jgi:tetratricopeptide (TPR) repeat protein
MDDMESKNDLSAFESARTDMLEFEPGLRRASELLQENDLDSAFALLSKLEAGYLRGAEVFLLLGEVLRRLGQTSRATRYKMLYDILRANFGIIDEAESRTEVREALEFHRAVEAATSFLEDPLGSKAYSGEEDPDSLEAIVPVTSAMAEQLMRQGHYKRAVEIYDRLLAKDPEDTGLMGAKDTAKKKAQEERVLGVFEIWLKNIQRMKGELTGEA